MRIELLGAGGYHPSERRHTACLLLPEIGLMLDAGTAAFRLAPRVAEGALVGERLDIVLTHAHLDHIAGLTYLFGLAHQGRPIETVVHAAPAVIDAIETHLLAPALFPIQPVTRFEALGEQLELPSGARLSTFPLDHPGGSLGVRISHEGKSIAYVTDTRRLTAATLDAIRGVDLLLHEAYFPEAQREFAQLTGHATAHDAAWAAEQCGAAKLVMMHLDPRADEAAEAISLAEAQTLRPDAEFGRDGQVVEV